jgi:hypothetical protein
MVKLREISNESGASASASIFSRIAARIVGVVPAARRTQLSVRVRQR